MWKRQQVRSQSINVAPKPIIISVSSSGVVARGNSKSIEFALLLLVDDADVWVGGSWEIVDAAVGTKVPEGAAAIHELAAASAPALFDGAAELTVAFPWKSQLWEFRFVIS